MENNEDEIARRRRALAEALRNNEPVSVTPSGELKPSEEASNEEGTASISVPNGKLALRGGNV